MAIDTVNDALDEAILIKGQIRTAIISKNVEVPANTPFSDYPAKVNAIKGILQTKNITPTAAGGDVTPDNGYDGFSKVTLPAEPNLIPANISDGVSIFGVTGTAQTASFDIAQFFARTLTVLSLGVTTLGDYLFYQYTTLQSFSDSALTKIGKYAFYNCTGLTSFSISSALQEIDDYGMYMCKAITNIGTLYASKIGNYGAYYLANTGTGFVFSPSTAASIGDYGLQYAKITSITGNVKAVGAHGLEYLGSGFTTISGNFSGSIGTYGLANNQYVKTVNFSNSNISALGTYAFYYFGYNRANYSTDPYMELDFHNSSFAVVDQYTFAYTRYVNIHLPASVVQINAYAFAYCSNLNLYMDGAAPTLSATTAFNSASNYKIYVSWNHAVSYQNGTNWSSLSANIVACAPAGTFTAGDTLPAYNGEGYAMTWYSDEAKTTQVTTCPAGSPMLYCTPGASKVKQVATVSATGPIAISVTDSNSNPVDLSFGYFFFDDGDTFSINATIESGYTGFITVNGTKVTSFPYSLTCGSSDITISGMAYDPSAINPDYSTATWREIKNAVDSGVAVSLYASYIGTIKNVTLTNGQTCRVRLVNNTADLYDYANGGKTGFVVEFLDALSTAYPMNQTNTNAGGWDASYMRNTVMPLFYNLLPTDFKEVLSPVKIKAAKSGNDGTLVTSEDTLFLAAEREIFATRQYSRTEEWNALTRWQFYAQNDTAADRIKYRNGSADNAGERSSRQGSGYGFCMVGSNGSASSDNASGSRAVAPAACI